MRERLLVEFTRTLMHDHTLSDELFARMESEFGRAKFIEAVGLLGPAVHKRDDVLRAMEHARDHDPDPGVRKKAAWFTPGGPRFERTKPRERQKNPKVASAT